LVPAFDGRDDFVGIGRPSERLWQLISLGEEAVDGGLQVDDGSKDATFQSLFAELGEETLHGVEPLRSASEQCTGSKPN
jgi:hypothetical protein